MTTQIADPYHFTPEVLSVSVDALVNVTRGKHDVIVWLRSAGISEKLLAPWREKLNANKDEVSKAAIARDILCKLNEGGDGLLRQRREVIKRLVETDDFSSCWPDKILVAQGLIARLRDLVNVKDSFTKMRMEAESASRRERQARDAEMQKARARASALRDIARAMSGLLKWQAEPHARGREFEKQLTRLFELSEIQVTEPFRLANEQIDGAVHFDGHTYLVEARWWAEALEHKDVADLFVKISERPVGTRGMYISASGFTKGCVEVCANAHIPALFTTLEDILLCLESERPLAGMLVKKYQKYSTERKIYVGYRELFF